MTTAMLIMMRSLGEARIGVWRDDISSIVVI